MTRLCNIKVKELEILNDDGDKPLFNNLEIKWKYIKGKLTIKTFKSDFTTVKHNQKITTATRDYERFM